MSENKIDWAKARRDALGVKREARRAPDSPCPTKINAAGSKVLLRVCDRAAILDPDLARGLAAWLLDCADEADQKRGQTGTDPRDVM